VDRNIFLETIIGVKKCTVPTGNIAAKSVPPTLFMFIVAVLSDEKSRKIQQCKLQS
jgi:hypothetical protein